MAILGELDRAGKLHTDVPTIHAKTMKDALGPSGTLLASPSAEVQDFYRAGPGGVPTQVAFSQASTLAQSGC
jgi:dihydroxy-acid dehydratase